MKKTHCICFDLTFNEDIKHYLPTGYIALENNNVVGYIEKRAALDTLNSYEIIITDEVIKLLDLCNSLKIEELYKKYNAKNKVKKPIKELVKDKVFSKVFNQYVSFKLNVFFEIVNKNRFPLCLNIDREKPFYSQQFKFAEENLKSSLHFQKLEDKIVYTLSLEKNKKVFAPSDKNTIILLNDPAWVLVDKIIYKLEEINGNKLTPFLKKKSVEIPEKNTKLYFETFIKDIVNKVEIEAEGFSITQNSDITKCILNPYFYFLNDIYFFDFIFEYQDVSFSFNDKRKFRSSLILENEIHVIQSKRNFEEEQKWVQKLTSLGIKKLDNDFLSFENVTHKYQNIELLIENKSLFEKNGFSIENLEVDNKKIASHFGTLSIHHQENEDWFDVKMQINCGGFVFPFTNIVPNLKSNNPFFELPSGTFFLIPNEWFSSYKPIVEFGKITNDTIVLKKNQFTLLENLPAFNSERIIQKQNIDYQPSINLKATLRNYQIDGIKWLIEHHYNQLGACLADDMGLGKTLQTLAVLQFVKDNLQVALSEKSVDLFSDIIAKEEPLKALVIVPSSLVFNWKNEAKKFTPSLKSIVYTGNDRKQIKNKLQLYDIVFTSYAIALKDVEHFKNLSFRYLILDESQYIKNKNSKIFNAIDEISAENKITLSGTPIENSLDDLWSQMQFINPDLLGSYSFFVKYFKTPIEKKKDETAISELKKLINPYILRRTKEQVAKDLPPISEQIFFSEMETEQKALYEKEKSIARNYLLNSTENHPINKLNILNTLMKLRQIGNHPVLVDENFNRASGKFLDVVQYLETLLKAKQKVLLFSSFVKHIEIYTDWCKKNAIQFCLLTGETAAQNRENEVNQFQTNPDKQLFFISLKAGGVGLNLTEASYVLLLDPWWNPFAENQAIARAHRIGQKNHVTVVRFIAKDTIEEKILSLQQKKKEISDAIIDIDKIPDDIETNLEYILG